MPGEQTFLISEDTFKLPKGVKLLDVEPSSLTLALVEIVEKEIPVKPQLVGRLLDGLNLKSVEIDPPIIRVLSPGIDEKVNEISLTTTPIYLESITEDAILFCKIIAPPGIQPVDKRWPDVEVRVSVESGENSGGSLSE